MGQFTGLMSVGVTFKISSNGLVAQTLNMTTGEYWICFK